MTSTHHRITRNIKRFKDGIDIIDLLDTSEVFRNGIDIIDLLNASDAFKNTVAIRDGIKLGQSRKMYII